MPKPEKFEVQKAIPVDNADRLERNEATRKMLERATIKPPEKIQKEEIRRAEPVSAPDGSPKKGTTLKQETISLKSTRGTEKAKFDRRAIGDPEVDT